jgi:hypothetical protein
MAPLSFWDLTMEKEGVWRDGRPGAQKKAALLDERKIEARCFLS